MSVGGRGLGVRGCVDDGLDSMTRTVDVEDVEVDDLVTSVYGLVIVTVQVAVCIIVLVPVWDMVYGNEVGLVGQISIHVS